MGRELRPQNTFLKGQLWIMREVRLAGIIYRHSVRSQMSQLVENTGDDVRCVQPRKVFLLFLIGRRTTQTAFQISVSNNIDTKSARPCSTLTFPKLRIEII